MKGMKSMKGMQCKARGPQCNSSHLFMLFVLFMVKISFLRELAVAICEERFFHMDIFCVL